MDLPAHKLNMLFHLASTDGQAHNLDAILSTRPVVQRQEILAVQHPESGETLLTAACMAGSDSVKVLLQHDPMGWDRPNRDGITPLWAAGVWGGHNAENLKLILATSSKFPSTNPTTP